VEFLVLEMMPPRRVPFGAECWMSFSFQGLRGFRLEWLVLWSFMSFG
jgi:hypothetical protein